MELLFRRNPYRLSAKRSRSSLNVPIYHEIRNGEADPVSFVSYAVLSCCYHLPRRLPLRTASSRWSLWISQMIHIWWWCWLSYVCSVCFHFPARLTNVFCAFLFRCGGGELNWKQLALSNADWARAEQVVPAFDVSPRLRS